MHATLTTAKIQRIQSLAAELDALGKTALEKALEAGTLLIECKADLAHGEWLPWLEENFTFTDRTARRWMKLVDDMQSGKLKSDTVSNLADAYRITTETREIKPNPCPFEMPQLNQRLILFSPMHDCAAIEPMDETYVQVTYTEPGIDLSLFDDGRELRIATIAGTKRGIHKDHAWLFLIENSNADWKNASAACVPWKAPDMTQTTRNQNLYGDCVLWMDECFSLETLEQGGLKG